MARSSFWADFRHFLMRGNVVDLAIAVVIGGAFGKIVNSLVEDIITPAILNPAMKAAKVENLQGLQYEGIKYGVFLAAILNFVVIAFCIFLLIRALEKAKRRFVREEAIAEPAPDPVLTSQERLTSAIEQLTATMSR